MGYQTDDYGRVSAPFSLRLTNDDRCATAQFQQKSRTGRKCTKLSYDEGVFSFGGEDDNIFGTQRVLTLEQSANTIETFGATEVGVFTTVRGFINGKTAIPTELESVPPSGQRDHHPDIYERIASGASFYELARILDLRPKMWMDLDLRCSWGGIETEVRRPVVHDNPHDPYRLLPTTRLDPRLWERHFEGFMDESSGALNPFGAAGIERNWSLKFTRAKMPHLSIRQDSTHVTPILRLQVEADPVGVEDLDIDIQIEGYVVFRPGRPEQRR